MQAVLQKQKQNVICHHNINQKRWHLNWVMRGQDFISTERIAEI